MRPDLKLHILAGVILSIAVGLVLGPAAGFVAATAAGVLKEVLWDDLLGKGTPALDDALYTTGGALAASLWVWAWAV